MIDAKALLEKFLGPDAGQRAAGGVHQASDAANRMLGKVGITTTGMGGLATGAAAGGLLALLLGGKSVRKLAGGVVGYGGAAALGALAYRALQNYQQGPSAPAQAPQAALPAPAANPPQFALALVTAMIGAAKADGHVDAAEQERIFAAVDRAGLDAEAKAFVFDTLSRPTDPERIAAAATTPEQAAELYLASRMAIDPDNPAERAYLEALTHRLKLAPALVAELERQLAGTPAAA